MHQLNEEQDRVVAQLKGPILAECCPGSGKTQTLTVRVSQMLTHHGIDPNNILCLTFTNKAAEEMKSRLRGLVGTSADKIWISTFHKLCIAILRKHGSLINLDSNFSIFDDRDQYELIRKVARMQEVEAVSEAQVKRLARFVNDAREDLHADLDKISSEMEPWEKDVCRDYMKVLDECNAVDFSGILFKAWVLLKKHLEVTQKLTARFQFVCVDEAQDTNQIQYEIANMIAAHNNILFVGDFQQCVHEDELLPVLVDGKPLDIRVKDLPKEGLIRSWRNEKVSYLPYSLAPSPAVSGVRIRLESGKEIVVSDHHRVYSTGPDLPKGYSLVYLMYCDDLGFRVGVTNKRALCYGQRTSHEAATKLWVLSIWEDREAALLEEERISLWFGVPTEVSNGELRGLNQNRINTIFEEFGENGYRVLTAYGLDFDLPLWSVRSYTSPGVSRRRINLCSHGPRGSQVSCEWMEPEFTEKVRALGLTIQPARRNKSARFRCRRFCNSYKEAVFFAEKLSSVFYPPPDDGRPHPALQRPAVREQMVVDGEFFLLTTASAVRPGCRLPVLCDGVLKGERVEAVQQLQGSFRSIDVDDSCLFFNSDGVLTHNSIYSWRGARPENLNRFIKDHPDATIVNFQENYRSQQTILDCAQNLIRHNENARHVVLKSNRGPGGVVNATAHSSPEGEAEHVAQMINKLRQKHNLHWGDFAILYRVNSLSRAPEAALRKYHIPYKVVGGFSFFDRAEVKTALAYLAFAANPANTIAFARAITNPKRGVGEVMVGKLEKYCKEQQVDMLTACKSGSITMNAKTKDEINKFVGVLEKVRTSALPLGQRAETLFKESGFYTYLVEESKSDPDYAKRVNNVEQLLVDVDRFGKDKPNGGFADYLHVVQLMSAEDEEEEDDSKVTLLSMHACKGLEFPVVFIIAAEKGTCPHNRAVAERGEEEERRLFYVSITRAKSFLFINYCVARSQWSEKWHREYVRHCEPSPFIEESGL